MSTLQERIVKDIVLDLRNRVGLNTSWELIDTRIRDQIENKWAVIVAEHIEKAYGSPYVFRRNDDNTAPISTDKNGNETTLWDDDNIQ